MGAAASWIARYEDYANCIKDIARGYGNIPHINGDHFDNHLENLKVLCPNCHAFTDNYSGRASSNK